MGKHLDLVSWKFLHVTEAVRTEWLRLLTSKQEVPDLISSFSHCALRLFTT